MHERVLKIRINYYDPVMNNEKQLNNQNGKILRIKAAILLQAVDEIGNFSDISDFENVQVFFSIFCVHVFS